jgi:hypothetical protein
VATGLLAAVASAPLPVDAADHLDAPGLTSPDGIAELDINDLYVFEGSPGKTVLAVTVSPVASADSDFAGFSNAYSFRIDTNGDAVEDVTYHVRVPLSFLDKQTVIVQRSQGRAATSLEPNGSFRGFGISDHTFGLRRGGRAFAGLRSDPFFFDLSGFLGTVEGRGEDALGQDPTDFFDGLNTLAIVLEVPDSELNDGGPIGVWATTSRRDGRPWKQVDRMGRPAINTVVNSSGPIVGAPSEAKNLYNAGRPADDMANFRQGVIDALQAYSSLDSEGAYSDAEAGALADVLLPDVLTFDKASALPAPLNGRALADDVIDTELRIATGGDPLGLFPGRDADGAINSDGVGPHDDYQNRFPYLGRPVTG